MYLIIFFESRTLNFYLFQVTSGVEDEGEADVESREGLRAEMLIETKRMRELYLASIISGEDLMNKVRNEAYRKEKNKQEAAKPAEPQHAVLIGHLRRILLEKEAEKELLIERLQKLDESGPGDLMEVRSGLTSGSNR